MRPSGCYHLCHLYLHSRHSSLNHRRSRQSVTSCTQHWRVAAAEAREPCTAFWRVAAMPHSEAVQKYPRYGRGCGMASVQLKVPNHRGVIGTGCRLERAAD